VTARVSVILCTKNRQASLAPTLESVGAAAVPPGWSVELIVVDNGSADGTAELVRAWRRPHLEVRYLHEAGPGKSFAYNAGLRAATGDILLCTDDDVRVPRGWIEGMARPILDGPADAVAGGVVLPAAVRARLEASALRHRPDWVASTERIDPQHVDHMVGANMAFHRRILERIPQFDVELGPGRLGYGEDTLLSWQIMAAGFRVAAHFDVAVEHHFDPARLTDRAVVEMARRLACSHAYLRHHWVHQRRPRWLRLKLAGALLRRARHRPRGGALSDAAIRAEEDVAYYGEFLRQSRRARRYVRHGLVVLAPP